MRTLRRIARAPSFFAGQALNRLLETSAQLADRCLYKPHVAWWNDRAWLGPYEEYLDGERILDRRFTLVQWARAARSLPGSTAECGVYKGVGSASICKALEGTYGEGEGHFGFDSFEGLSDPCEADRRPREGKRSWALWYTMRKDWRRGDLRCAREVAQGRVRDFPFCQLIQGWIPTSFAQVPQRSYRFVHLDLDIYQPTWDSLGYFYPRMVSGGMLFFDDYGHLTCPGCRRAVDEFFRDKRESIVEFATGQALVIKCPNA